MSPAHPAYAATVARLRTAGCVFAEEEASLLLAEYADPVVREERLARRVAGEPLETVLGWAAFGGLRVVVEPHVFVPRRRTELLAREALTAARAVPYAPVVVDLCCGSGAVAAVVAAGLDGAEVWAADVDPAATACARRNLDPARVLTGDLFDPLPDGLRERGDVLVANVPYVPSAAIGLMPREAREHEARVALDGGDDGLAVLRRVVAGAADWLAPGGTVLVETSRAQLDATVAAFAGHGLAARVARDEDLDATVVAGTPG